MAIDDLLDEHEQSERVRTWLKNNAASWIGGIALGLAVIFGWKWWQQQQARQTVQANASYLQAVQLLAAGDLEKGKAAVAKLETGKVAIYADLAGLRLAQVQVDAGQLEPAISTLKGLKPEPSLQPLVNLRLARVLIDTGKGEEALKLLGDANDSASLETRGDALVALGKPEQARELYLKALTGMDVAAPQRRMVELKLTDVGGTPPKPAQTT